MNDKYIGLQNKFSLNLLEVPNNNDICIVQVPIFRLLTMTCWYNKVAVVTKTLVKSIYLDVQLWQFNY